MTVYWYVWIAVIVLASKAKDYDYPMPMELANSRVRHSNIAKIFFIAAAAILILVAGCRYYVGTDFGAYYKFYYGYLDLAESLKNLEEPGIRLIYYIAVRIHDSAGMCVLTAAAVTIGLQLSTFYKNTNNLSVALVLYLFTCWYQCFNGVRQALAAAVLFCGFTALRDKKFARYVIIVLLAYLCHKSAIVMLPIYFAVNQKVNVRNIIIISALTAIVLLSYSEVFGVVNVVLDNNVTGEDVYWSTQVNIFRTLANSAPAVFFLFFYRKKEKTRAVNFYLNLLIIHAVVAVSTSGSASFGRMIMYTMPYAVISMAELIKGLPYKKRDLYVFIIVILYWVMQFYEVYMSSSLNNFQLKWFW